MKVLVLEGPNLNLVGTREPHHYGSRKAVDVHADILAIAETLGMQVEFRQTNHEGVLVDWIQAAAQQVQGIVLNPGGLCHSSVCILDAVVACGVPVVEVHYTNLTSRESFRSQIGLSMQKTDSFSDCHPKLST